MPVQFTCSHCRRRLSVGHRKAGTTVACPKCGQPNVVPGSSLSQVGGPPVTEAEAGELEIAAPPAVSGPPVLFDPAIVFDPPAVPDSPAVPEKSTSPEPVAAAFDDVLQLITVQDTGKAAAAPAPQPPPEPAALSQVVSVAVAGVPPPIAPPPLPPVIESRSPPVGSLSSRAPAARRGRHDNGTVLMLSRRAVYAQAALAGGLTLLAFLAGLTIGRSSRPANKADSGKQAAGEPVPLEGYILYSLTPGRSMPDAGAIVIALPAGKTPSRKLAARGLRPGDGDELSDLPAVDDLRALGGAVARADESGQFQLVVPQPGEFSILIVSRRAKRPYNQTIALADQEELSRVFASPSDLIGQQRYAIVSRRLAGAPRPYTHEFGSTDKS